MSVLREGEFGEVQTPERGLKLKVDQSVSSRRLARHRAAEPPSGVRSPTGCRPAPIAPTMVRHRSHVWTLPVVGAVRQDGTFGSSTPVLTGPVGDP